MRHFHPADNYDGIKERHVMVDVDGEMIEVCEAARTVHAVSEQQVFMQKPNSPLLRACYFSFSEMSIQGHSRTTETWGVWSDNVNL